MEQIPVEDIKQIIQCAKREFDEVTMLLNNMPMYNIELPDWQIKVRTIHYDLGISIENLERIIQERVPEILGN